MLRLIMAASECPFVIPLNTGASTAASSFDSANIDEAVGSTSMQFLLSHLETPFDTVFRRVLKYVIDLFQREISRLRVAKVDQWYKYKVERHEDEITFPGQSAQQDRSTVHVSIATQ